MYFGIAKIIFTNDPQAPRYELKSAKILCDKLKQNLKVCARSYSSGIPSIAVTLLARDEQAIEITLDKVLDICEKSDLGRIEAEYTLIEPVDILEEDEEVEE